MAETVTIDRPPVAKATVSAKPATVSASALALHLDCSRTYIGKLEAEGVIQRQGDGFPLDASRVAYLRFLRRERRQSPRSEEVPYVTMCNLSNLEAALRGGLPDLIELRLMCVGAGPTLDYADAVAFLAGFEPLIEKVRRRRMQ
jgi:hypothetical protein